ncbi:hypothetical protein V8C44DRAFT_351328 [Trichoderma aethiopicum]
MATAMHILVRCGHFERPPPPSSASAFGVQSGSRPGASRGNSSSKHDDIWTDKAKSSAGQRRRPETRSQDARQWTTTRSRPAAAGKSGLPLLVLSEREAKARQSGGRWPAWDWPIQRNKVRHDAAARQVWAHPFDKELLDGVWSVGCVSHRLGVVARSKSDGAVASPSIRGPCWGSIDSRTLKGKGLFGSWRDWRRVFARS